MSVVIRNRPELQDKPVAVCHSDNPKGTAEISSANYPARSYGWFYSKSSISLSTYIFYGLCIFCIQVDFNPYFQELGLECLLEMPRLFVPASSLSLTTLKHMRR